MLLDTTQGGYGGDGEEDSLLKLFMVDKYGIM